MVVALTCWHANFQSTRQDFGGNSKRSRNRLAIKVIQHRMRRGDLHRLSRFRPHPAHPIDQSHEYKRQLDACADQRPPGDDHDVKAAVVESRARSDDGAVAVYWRPFAMATSSDEVVVVDAGVVMVNRSGWKRASSRIVITM